MTRSILQSATLALSFALLHAAAADEPAFSKRGKLLLSESFSGAALAPQWQGKLGTWEIVNGAAKVSERTEDKHAAVRRHPLQYHDAIFEFSFRLDGARMIGLSLNNKSGHVCRLTVTPRGMVLQTDKPNANSDLQPAKVAALTIPISIDQWHKVVVEVRGRRMMAQLDGGKVISGENALVDVDKTDVGLAVSGMSAWLKDLRVYEIQANN